MTGWWFGTMEFYDFPFSWEFHHPNWRTHIFQRGRSTTNQMTFHDFPWFSYGWVVGFLRTVPCSCCSHRFLLVVAICFVDPNSGWVGQPAYWLIARFCQWRACFLWGEIRFLLSRNPIFLLSRNLNGPLILMFFPGENATVFFIHSDSSMKILSFHPNIKNHPRNHGFPWGFSHNWDILGPPNGSGMGLDPVFLVVTLLWPRAVVPWLESWWMHMWNHPHSWP